MTTPFVNRTRARIFHNAAGACSTWSVGRCCCAAEILGRSGSFALPNYEIYGLRPALRACARCGVAPTRHLLAVHIARQTTALFQRQEGGYALQKIFRCSTSKYGIGEKAGSNMTPRGLHRVAQKIGGGWPVGVAFKGRQVVGFTWQGQPLAPIAHRILRLEGLEPGLNRGGDVDSFRRFIYIHGTGNETALGRPDSHGCVHLSANDLLPLYDKLPEGTLVWMSV